MMMMMLGVKRTMTQTPGGGARIVPCFAFGENDLYDTSRVLIGARRALAKAPDTRARARRHNTRSRESRPCGGGCV